MAAWLTTSVPISTTAGRCGSSTRAVRCRAATDARARRKTRSASTICPPSYISPGPGIPPLADGTYDNRRLSLIWYDVGDLLDLIGGFEPLDVLNLPIPITSAFASYMQQTRTCVDGVCSTAAQTTTNFLVSSISMGVTPVPEPSTFALLAIGLLGSTLARRPLKVRT